MRALTTCLVAAVLVAGAFSAACTQLTGGALYATAGTCSSYTTCGNTFCSCVGSSSTSPNTCLANAPNTTTCATISTCLSAYTMCIESVPAVTCSSLNASLKLHVMAAHTSGYFNSTLQRSCRNRVCSVMNATDKFTCAFGTNDMDVCHLPPLMTTAAPMTAAPNTTANSTASMETTVAATTAAPTSAAPAGFQAAIRATFVFGGADFAAIRNNATAWGLLRQGIQTDLGTLLQVNRQFVHIFRMTVASLEVDFGVDTAAGVQPSVLQTRVQAGANSTSWLTSTQDVVTQTTGETMTVTGLTVTQTVSPDNTNFATTTIAATTQGPISSSASAGVVSALAAVFAALVAVAAL